VSICVTLYPMDVSCLPCPLCTTYHTYIALKGIHTIMFGEEIARIRKLGVQGVSYVCHSFHTANTQLLFQALNFLTVIASGLMMWKGLCLVTNSESPIVVVLSYVSWKVRGHHELTRQGIHGTSILQRGYPVPNESK
jgi:hypothetical protein